MIPYMKENWNKRKLDIRVDGKMVLYTLWIAPDWNPSYFRRHMDGQIMADAIAVLQDIKNRKPERMAWKVTKDNEIYIYRNNAEDERFHEPKSLDMTQKVYAVLRGKDEWSTSQDANTDIWST